MKPARVYSTSEMTKPDGSMLGRKSDWIGIIGSTACLMHCVALPALFYVLQLGWGFDSHWYDYAFALIALGAVGYSVRKITSISLKALLLISIVLFVSGLVLEHTYSFSKTLLHIGSLGLITGHALNLRKHYRKKPLTSVRPSVAAGSSSATVPRLHPQAASSL